MTASLSRAQIDLWLRILAAIVGTLPVALLGSACLARFLPLSEDVRFAIGFTAAIPLWITGMCFAYLARNGARAWLVCLLTSAALAAFVYGMRQETTAEPRTMVRADDPPPRSPPGAPAGG